MSSLHLASVLLVAVRARLNVRFFHERLAAATHSPKLQNAVVELHYGQDAKEPETTGRHGVSFLEVSQCFQLVLGVLDACLLALVVLIEAHSVSHMCPEMPRPQLRVMLEVIL